jgi:Protein of unknown function (DUF4232)
MRKTLVRTALGLAVVPFVLTACGDGTVTGTLSTSKAPTAPAGGEDASAQGGRAEDSVRTESGSNTKRISGEKSEAKRGAKRTTAVCSTIKADLQMQQEGSAMVMLTNTGSRPCAVNGWPAVRMLSANGEELAARARKANQPGPASRIVLKPGATAFSGLKWKSCDKSQTSCTVVSSFSIGAPGSTRRVNAHLTGVAGGNQQVIDIPIAARSLQAGTLQPSSQGVVAW